MDRKHKRVLATLGIAILILIAACVSKAFQLPNQIALSTNGQPTVGKGAIQIVLFEDLGCVNCHHFTRNVVPKIASEYIDTGRARFTVVPVSFESQSIQLANAALAVYRIAPTQFIPYMMGLLDIEGSSKSSLLKVAQMVGGIDLEKLGYAIDRRIFFGEIERNLAWAESIIADFGTPMLYVNGYETPTDSFKSLQKRIDQLGKMQ